VIAFTVTTHEENLVIDIARGLAVKQVDLAGKLLPLGAGSASWVGAVDETKIDSSLVLSIRSVRKHHGYELT